MTETAVYYDMCAREGWTCDYDDAALTKGIDTRGWERLPVSVP